MALSALIKGGILKGVRILVSMPPRVLQGRSLVQANSGSQTMSLATAPTSGNLMVVICGALGSRTFTAPAGWSASIISVTNSPSLQAFYKIAGGSETNSYTFTTTGTPDWQSDIFEIVDFSSSSPIQFSASSATGSGKTADAASASQTVNSNSLVLSVIHGNGSMGITPQPSNNFIKYTTSNLHYCATRRYFLSATSQNSTWTWQTARTTVCLFIGINPR